MARAPESKRTSRRDPLRGADAISRGSRADRSRSRRGTATRSGEDTRRPAGAHGALILDRYRTIKRLDPTGYGQVVIAWDERMRRRVAIKEIKIPAGTSGEQILAEARTAAMLNHPNIVAVHDVDLSPGVARIIMEYVEGSTLVDIADDLDDNSLASVVKQIGAGLEYAHRNGVLHLDIKPANILVSIEGHVKIADFGLAALSGSAGYSAAEGGTIGYMPLEQLEGDPATEATDQWAFAAVLYELATGEFPYEDELGRRPSYDRMLEAQLADEPHLLQTGNLALDQVLMRGLARNPESRYLSVAAFADDALDTLGNSDLGRTHLHGLVSELNRDDIDDWLEGLDSGSRRRRRDEDDPPREWWKLADNILAAIVSGLVVWRATSAVADPDLALVIGLIAALAIVSAIAPRLGLALAVLTVSIVLMWGQLWALSIPIVITGMIWWYFVGRSSDGLSTLALFILATLVESNIPGSTLATWAPQLFADNIAWVNVGLTVLLILVSIPTALRLWRER